MKILLTGEPGAGKTTLLKRFIESATDMQGFLAEEVRVDGQRVGFRLVAHTGATAMLAHVDSVSPVRVSRYGVEVDALDRFLNELPPLDPSKPIYVDEIGQMQLSSEVFRRKVATYLDAAILYIGTISLVYEDDYIHEILERRDVVRVHLTAENRDRIAEAIEGLARNVESFMALNEPQRALVTEVMQYYVGKEQYVQLRKLLKNAVKYIATGSVRVTEDGYIVAGHHDDHTVQRGENGTYVCDCDLFHGRGEFAVTGGGECSHIQAVRLYITPSL